MQIGSSTENRIGDLNPAVKPTAGGNRISSTHANLSVNSIGPMPFIDMIPNRNMLPAPLYEEAERIGSISLDVLSTRACCQPEIAGGRVAIIVPTYNVQGLVQETLSSIASQDYLPFEVIIVDDGSVDATAERICQFMQRHTDLLAMRFVQIPHIGNPGLSRNIGLYNLLSPEVNYVAFMDGDDLYASPTALTKLVQGFRFHPEAFAMFGDYDWMGEDGRIIARPNGIRKRKGQWRWRSCCELTWDNIAQSNLGTYHLQCLMVRMGAPLLSYHSRGEDEDYYARLFRMSAERYDGRLDGVGQIPEPIAHYRKRSSSLSYRPLAGNAPVRQAHEPKTTGGAHPEVPEFYRVAGIPQSYITRNNVSRWVTKRWARLFWRALFSGQIASAIAFLRRAMADKRINGRHLIWLPLVEILMNPMVRDMGFAVLGRIKGRLMRA